MSQVQLKLEEPLVGRHDVAEALEEGLTQLPFQNKDGEVVYVTSTKSNGQMVEFELTDGSSFSLLIRKKQSK